jgi:AAT family amino acid transporter
MCYGLGANIGSNFFLFIGPLIIAAGPSVVLSFLIGGVISLITAFCFAELSSRKEHSTDFFRHTNQWRSVLICLHILWGASWMDVSITATFRIPLIPVFSQFVLMSFEYGLSSALNAVGFMETLNFALK